MRLTIKSPDENFEDIAIDFLPHVRMADAAKVVAQALDFDLESGWALVSPNPYVLPGAFERLDLNFLDGDWVYLALHSEPSAEVQRA